MVRDWARMPLFLFLGGAALQRCGNGTIWNAASAAEANNFHSETTFPQAVWESGAKNIEVPRHAEFSCTSLDSSPARSIHANVARTRVHRNRRTAAAHLAHNALARLLDASLNRSRHRVP